MATAATYRSAAAHSSWDSMVDERAWLGVCVEVLERMQVGVVGCDRELRIVALTAQGARLITCFAPRAGVGSLLPPVIRRAGVNWLADARVEHRDRPVRLETPGGRLSVYASFGETASPDVFLTVMLRREVIRNEVLLDALRRAYSVTAREFQLICLVREGQSNRQIATTLGLTYGTVKSYLHRLFERLDVHSRVELIALVEYVRSEQTDRR